MSPRKEAEVLLPHPHTYNTYSRPIPRRAAARLLFYTQAIKISLWVMWNFASIWIAFSCFYKILSKLLLHLGFSTSFERKLGRRGTFKPFWHEENLHPSRKRQICVQSPALLLTNTVTGGKDLNFLSFSSFICQVGILSTCSQDCPRMMEMVGCSGQWFCPQKVLSYHLCFCKMCASFWKKKNELPFTRPGGRTSFSSQKSGIYIDLDVEMEFESQLSHLLVMPP